MPIYEKSTRDLMYDMVKDLGVKSGDLIERKTIVDWFKKNYPKIKTGTVTAHIIMMTTNAPSRLHHTRQANLFFQVDSSHFELYDAARHPKPITKEDSDEDDTESVESIGAQPSTDAQFAYERDLQNFFARNLSLIEPGLEIYSEDDAHGLEFPVGGRFIDILAIDRNKNFVVVELKVSRGYDRVVGQILRYISWVRENLADTEQQVRGIIIARKVSPDLLLACKEIEHVDLQEYELSVELKKIDKSKAIE